MDQFIFPNCGRYFKKDYENLKHKFPGAENIENNFSQAFQDMFVLGMLNGKKNGTYVEIGGDHPVVINNSYLLESEFGWKGVSFEIIQSAVDFYNTFRKSPCLCEDATTADYVQIFEENDFPGQIDYLQVDIEPAQQTLNALKQIPFDQYRFSVITYETDVYRDGPDCQEEAMNFLLSHGYELVIRNVANEGNPYEDWYVDPTVVDRDIIDKFKQTGRLSKESNTCVLNV
jgi:hypothetical protein